MFGVKILCKKLPSQYIYEKDDHDFLREDDDHTPLQLIAKLLSKFRHDDTTTLPRSKQSKLCFYMKRLIRTNIDQKVSPVC